MKKKETKTDGELGQHRNDGRNLSSHLSWFHPLRSPCMTDSLGHARVIMFLNKTEEGGWRLYFVAPALVEAVNIREERRN